MIYEFESRELLNRFDTSFKRLASCIERVVLPDGRIAEVQIIVTTEAELFCKEIDKMTAWQLEE